MPALLSAVVANAAVASGIDTVREKVKHYSELSDRYAARALKLSNIKDLEVPYRNIDAKEQTCMVLIDLLGVEPGTSFQSVQSEPDSDSDESTQQILYALSLKSYIIAAETLLQENDFSWRYRWNLDCAGVYGADRHFNIKDTPPFALSMSSDGKTLSIIGDVTDGLHDAIAKRLTIHGTINRVELMSQGGLTYEALKIGRLLRKRMVTTVVSGNCYSSCALIFLGGVKRIVPAPYWDLGFHRASERGSPLWDGDEVYEAITAYVDEMIGGGNRLVMRSFDQRGLDFYRPTRRDLCSWNIATRVEAVCEADSEK